MTTNFGDVLDAIGPALGDKPAIIHDGGITNWATFDRRSNALARAMVDAGVVPGERVAFLLFNGPEYLELLAATFKARLVHANINYRYVAAEIAHLITDSDAKVLVFDHRLADTVAGIDPAVLDGRVLVQVGGDAAAVDSAVLYENLIASTDGSPLEIDRSSADQIFIYTGGTTGYPKGVVWEIGDMAEVIFGAELPDEPVSTKAIVALTRDSDRPKPYSIGMVASPLMHGAGLWMAITMMCNGDTSVVTDNASGFDASRHVDVIEANKVEGMAIVGDPFARPLVDVLQTRPGAVASLRIIGSSGAIWSAPVKQQLLALHPGMVLLDLLASTEAAGLGSAASTVAGGADTASFDLGPNCRVFDENDELVEAGSDRQGHLAVGGPQPVGYHNDPGKTAATFRTIDGVRYSFPGDVCTVDADGTIRLLGRGSNCINTAGEKVFPEEVEEAAKTHPAVRDCLVVGLDDPKWGQAVAAVVEANAGSVDAEALRAYLKDGRLAGYKVPKQVVVVPRIERKANGKADYPAARALFDRPRSVA